MALQVIIMTFQTTTNNQGWEQQGHLTPHLPTPRNDPNEKKMPTSQTIHQKSGTTLSKVPLKTLKRVRTLGRSKPSTPANKKTTQQQRLRNKEKTLTNLNLWPQWEKYAIIPNPTPKDRYHSEQGSTKNPSPNESFNKVRVISKIQAFHSSQQKDDSASKGEKTRTTHPQTTMCGPNEKKIPPSPTKLPKRDSNHQKNKGYEYGQKMTTPRTCFPVKNSAMTKL